MGRGPSKRVRRSERLSSEIVPSSSGDESRVSDFVPSSQNSTSAVPSQRRESRRTRGLGAEPVSELPDTPRPTKKKRANKSKRRERSARSGSDAPVPLDTLREQSNEHDGDIDQPPDHMDVDEELASPEPPEMPYSFYSECIWSPPPEDILDVACLHIDALNIGELQLPEPYRLQSGSRIVYCPPTALDEDRLSRMSRVFARKTTDPHPPPNGTEQAAVETEDPDGINTKWTAQKLKARALASVSRFAVDLEKEVNPVSAQLEKALQGILPPKHRDRDTHIRQQADNPAPSAVPKPEKSPAVKAVRPTGTSFTTSSFLGVFPINVLSLQQTHDFVSDQGFTEGLPSRHRLYTVFRLLGTLYPFLYGEADHLLAVHPTVAARQEREGLISYTPRLFRWPFPSGTGDFGDHGQFETSTIKTRESRLKDKMKRRKGKDHQDDTDLEAMQTQLSLSGREIRLHYFDDDLFAHEKSSKLYPLPEYHGQPLDLSFYARPAVEGHPSVVLKALSDHMAPLVLALRAAAIQKCETADNWPTRQAPGVRSMLDKNNKTRKPAPTTNNETLPTEDALDLLGKAFGDVFVKMNASGKFSLVHHPFPDAEEAVEGYKAQIDHLAGQLSSLVNSYRRTVARSLANADTFYFENRATLAEWAKWQDGQPLPQNPNFLSDLGKFLEADRVYQSHTAVTPEGWLNLQERCWKWCEMIAVNSAPHQNARSTVYERRNDARTRVQKLLDERALQKAQQEASETLRELNEALSAPDRSLQILPGPENLNLRPLEAVGLLDGFNHVPEEWDVWDLNLFLGIDDLQTSATQVLADKYKRDQAHARSNDDSGGIIWLQPDAHRARSACIFPYFQHGYRRTDPMATSETEELPGITPHYHQLHAVALFFARAFSTDPRSSDARSMVLADEPGLGKTVTIAMIIALWRHYKLRTVDDSYRPPVMRNIKPEVFPWETGEELGRSYLGGPWDTTGTNLPIVIIAPTSVAKQHRPDLERILSGEHFIVSSGPPTLVDRATRKGWWADYDRDVGSRQCTPVWVMTWNDIQREVAYAKQHPLERSMVGSSMIYPFVFYDEAHEARNPWSNSFKAAYTLSQHAQSRWAVTATPIMNSPLDLLNVIRLTGYNAAAQPRMNVGQSEGPSATQASQSAPAAQVPPPEEQSTSIDPPGSRTLTHPFWYSNCHEQWRELVQTFAGLEKMRLKIQHQVKESRNADSQQGTSQSISASAPNTETNAPGNLGTTEHPTVSHPPFARKQNRRDLREQAINDSIYGSPENTQKWQEMTAKLLDTVLLPMCNELKHCIIRRTHQSTVSFTQQPLIPPIASDNVNVELYLEGEEWAWVSSFYPVGTDPVVPAGFQIQARMATIDPHATLYRVLNPKAPASAKITKTADICREVLSKDAGLPLSQQRKVLIYLHWSSLAQVVCERLRKLGIPVAVCTGDHSENVRYRMCSDFQKDESMPSQVCVGWEERNGVYHRCPQPSVPCRVMIITDALSAGVNLHRASVLIVMDPPWNYSTWHQIVGRVVRIGQTRPVSIYNLIAMGTVDQWMNNITNHKSAWNRLPIDRQKAKQAMEMLLQSAVPQGRAGQAEDGATLVDMADDLPSIDTPSPTVVVSAHIDRLIAKNTYIRDYRQAVANSITQYNAVFHGEDGHLPQLAVLPDPYEEQPQRPIARKTLGSGVKPLAPIQGIQVGGQGILADPLWSYLLEYHPHLVSFDLIDPEDRYLYARTRPVLTSYLDQRMRGIFNAIGEENNVRLFFWRKHVFQTCPASEIVMAHTLVRAYSLDAVAIGLPFARFHPLKLLASVLNDRGEISLCKARMFVNGHGHHDWSMSDTTGSGHAHGFKLVVQYLGEILSSKAIPMETAEVFKDSRRRRYVNSWVDDDLEPYWKETRQPLGPGKHDPLVDQPPAVDGRPAAERPAPLSLSDHVMELPGPQRSRDDSVLVHASDEEDAEHEEDAEQNPSDVQMDVDDSPANNTQLGQSLSSVPSSSLPLQPSPPRKLGDVPSQNQTPPPESDSDERRSGSDTSLTSDDDF